MSDIYPDIVRPAHLRRLTNAEVIRRLRSGTLHLSYRGTLSYSETPSHPPQLSDLPELWQRVAAAIHPVAQLMTLREEFGLSHKELRFITAHLIALGLAYQPRQNVLWSSPTPVLESPFTLAELALSKRSLSGIVRRDLLRDLEAGRNSRTRPETRPAIPELWTLVQQLQPRHQRTSDLLRALATAGHPLHTSQLRWIVIHLRNLKL